MQTTVRTGNQLRLSHGTKEAQHKIMFLEELKTRDCIDHFSTNSPTNL